MTDLIVIILLIAVIGGALFYVIKTKKSGKKCIGCPDSTSCHGTCSSCPKNGPKQDS
jgi:hypothetical protein